MSVSLLPLLLCFARRRGTRRPLLVNLDFRATRQPSPASVPPLHSSLAPSPYPRRGRLPFPASNPNPSRHRRRRKLCSPLPPPIRRRRRRFAVAGERRLDSLRGELHLPPRDPFPSSLGPLFLPTGPPTSAAARRRFPPPGRRLVAAPRLQNRR